MQGLRFKNNMGGIIIKRLLFSFILFLVFTLSFSPLVLSAGAPDAAAPSLTDGQIESDKQAVQKVTTTSDKAEDVLSESDANNTPPSNFSEKIKSFTFSGMIADVKNSVKTLNFIPWYTYYTQGKAYDENGADHPDKGWESIYTLLKDSGTSFGEFCAQYSAVMTNWAYTMGAIAAIIVLLIKGNKKWYWYVFFVIVAVMSVTSVGMHTADYGEFARYTMTTKLLASYIDMSFTELMAWSGVLCFTFEFYENRPKLKKRISTGVTIWAAIVLAVLTFEVFVINNRFLWIGGRGPDGLPYDMGGDHGGLSLAEFGCFITCLPLLYIIIANFKKTERKERGLVLLIIGCFAVAFVITSLWGDNEINSIAQGNLQGHSLWHLFTALGTISTVFWVDYRTVSQQHRIELDKANDKIRQLEEKLIKTTV